MEPPERIHSFQLIIHQFNNSTSIYATELTEIWQQCTDIANEPIMNIDGLLKLIKGTFWGRSISIAIQSAIYFN